MLIELESWQQKKLNLVFSEGEKIYCPSCYNGVQDADEEGIDCGNSCGSCKEAQFKLMENVQILLWLLALVFFVLALYALASANKRKKKASF